MYKLLFVVFLLGHGLLFFGGLQLGISMFSKSSGLQKLGNKLLAQKEKQLNNTPLLKRFAKAVDEGALFQARTIIAALIFVKSLGMALIGFIGLSILVIPIQGLMMAAIIGQMKLRNMPTDDLNRVLRWQLTSMLVPTALGNWAGWEMWLKDRAFDLIIQENLYLLITSLLISLILAIVAADKEVRYYQENKTLLS